MSKSINRLSFGIFGGVAGGVIAAAGYLLLQPQTDSVVLFILLRVAVGAVVAMIVGPILVKNKNK